MFRRSIHNESTPIVVDGLLFYTDLKDLVIAVDARTGTERWRYQPDLGATALCCGVINRGVAVYSNRCTLPPSTPAHCARRATGKKSPGTWRRRAAEGYSFHHGAPGRRRKDHRRRERRRVRDPRVRDAYDPRRGSVSGASGRFRRPRRAAGTALEPTTPDGEGLRATIAQEEAR